MVRRRPQALEADINCAQGRRQGTLPTAALNDGFPTRASHSLYFARRYDTADWPIQC
jgi:hypothetical protein